MDREAIRRAAVRYGLLFAISVALVAGFWFHAEFYQLGLANLLIVGGLATFLVLLAIRALHSGVLWRGRPRWTLPFPREASERVLAGTQTVAILPLAANVPAPGSRARVVVGPTARVLAEVRISDVRRRLLADVKEDEAASAGYDGLDGLRAAWARGRAWNPREIVQVVEFRREVRG